MFNIRIGIKKVLKINIQNTIIGLIATVLFWTILNTDQAKGHACWPDGWEDMEIEAKWETADPSVPICNDGMPNPDATYNTIIAAFPNGGTYSTANTYTLNVLDDGISRKYVDIYYDNAEDELSNSLHVLRHRTRYTTRPPASSNCPETLEQATLREDWERVQYKSTPFLFTPIWFRLEAGNACNVWDRRNENLCDEQSVPDIMAGNLPTHPAIQRLLMDHPDFDFSTNKPFLEVTQWRYRVEFLDDTGNPVYEMTLDQVTTKQLPGGDTTFSVEVELEAIKENKDVNDIMELFTIAAQLQDEFNLIPSTKSKGGIEVPGRISVPPGDVASLINAINKANSNGESTIIHLEGGTYTMTEVNNNTDGDNGLPSIISNITITHCDNANPIIERDVSEFTPSFRIFHIAGTGTLELEGITVMKGATAAEQVPENLEHDGGGIKNFGELTIKNCTVSNNMAGDDGGGIYNAGTAIIISSIISNNIAHSSYGGIWNLGTMTIINSAISNNQSIGRTVSAGGGIGNNGDLTLSSCTVKDNADNGGSGGGGGGIVNFGNLTINNTDICGNYSIFEGGGIHHRTGSMTIINSTIANNTVPYHYGGGIWVNFQAPCLLINCTVSKNSAGSGGGGIASPVGSTSVKIQNTIIAGNTAQQGAAQDCFGDIISLGNNLIGNTTGRHVNIILQPSDLTGYPGLGTFTNNGTPGNGHFPLLASSPAIDAGNNDACPETDQLGMPRVDGRCDIGAIEFFPIVNDLVSEAKEERTTSYNPVPVPNGPAGTFTITATFTNESSTPIQNPFFKVVELTSGNLLLNADGGAGGVGATLTPDVGDDGVLSPGESFTAEFVIGLQERKRFRFFVDILGVEEAGETFASQVAELRSTNPETRRAKFRRGSMATRISGNGFFGRFRP
ncbi:MAG: choice-of-anchor Q domain-containing protein [Candidatus Loosdrechtia sp.]|uniref:right-handed parallel beta-helix repeat-containing protein n=1 Tax=Candidatus Loosdrechtia sp. TaxID=3101272 RepID=UPI003A665F41|nr:MAG: right-handed parallel beta-helix repeat-containing protein [Candidatus Jettenia sp. AMX2]